MMINTSRLLLIGSFVFSSWLHAEPWLASRFAQDSNSESLSCKGCHTNPSGGGLRNPNGKWLQMRLLNSAYFKTYRLNEPRPEAEPPAFTEEKVIKLEKGAKRKATTIVPLKTVDDDSSRTLQRIPFNAGLDARIAYMDYNYKSNTRNDKVQNGYWMMTDVAASVEPFHGITAAVEARFLNNARHPAFDRGASTAGVRSAYLLVDDLPYNSYVQFGLYRPLFGHQSTDNSSLLAEVTRFQWGNLSPSVAPAPAVPEVQSPGHVYKALSLGTAMDKPFANLHVIDAQSCSTCNKDKGFAANLGVNFRVSGLYGMLSYWSTSADYGTAKYKRNMNSVTGGGTFWRYTFALDITRVTREEESLVTGTRVDTGNVLTFENRLRVWRENYLKAAYETLNTARNLTEGSTSAFSVGISAFPVSSLELEVVYKDLKEKLPNDSIAEKSAMAQLHLFF